VHKELTLGFSNLHTQTQREIRKQEKEQENRSRLTCTHTSANDHRDTGTHQDGEKQYICFSVTVHIHELYLIKKS
jgi:hypothetical protein